MSGVTVVWGGGTVLGPLVGGAFAESPATWRWAFYINLVIGAVFAPSLFWFLPNIDLKDGTPTLHKLRTMDWLGIVVFFGGATCFTMALNFGGTVYGWSSRPEIILWVFTGILLIAFFLISHYHPFVALENRLYPLHFYRKLEFANLQLQILLVSGIILTTAYYIPLYFQLARGDDAMQAAVRLLPFVLTLVSSSLCNGFAMPRLGYHKPWFVGGSGLYLIGCALMYTNTPTTPVANIYGYSILMGLGSGAYLMAGFNVVEKMALPSDLSNAVSFMAIGTSLFPPRQPQSRYPTPQKLTPAKPFSAQDIGLILLLALSGSIYQNTTRSHLQPLLSSSSNTNTNIELLLAGTSNDAFQSLTPVSLKESVVREVTKGIGGVWALLMAAAAASFVFAIGLGNGSVYR
ncbi:MAG: hypothetical protein Q9196_005210 [Gyalolechia fulgens]